jgi:hypothetical protein
MAAYTSTPSVKRVVSTKSGSGAMFSSNYLLPGSTASLKSIPFNNADSKPLVSVYICNYVQGDKTQHYSKDITYTLTAKLVDSNGNDLSADSFDSENWFEYYSIKLGNEEKVFDSSMTVEFSNQQLSSDNSNEDKYDITFDYLGSGLQTGDVYIYAEAVPESMEDGNSAISRIIGIYAESNQTSSWSGNFTDKFVSDSSLSPVDFDGFNYEISGSGVGTATLSWNEKYVKISPIFIESISDIKTEQTSGSITFKVDSSVQNEYSLQFYRVQPDSDSEEDWNPDTKRWEDENWDISEKSVCANGDNYVSFEFEAEETD